MKNVNDITTAALMETYEDDEFSELVLSAPTVDITNLKTFNLGANDNTEVFKQDVVVSCRNMFTVAANAIRKHPNLRKVVILEHPPRFDFDKPEADPLCLKPQLAKYANVVFGQLWLDSPCKDKIVIGVHNLFCHEDKFDHLYIDERTNRSDGLHFYGRGGGPAFTRSLIQILKNVVPQPNQKKTTFVRKVADQYRVPVNNRFDVLGN